MSSITITYLYRLLSEKIGKESAENLTSYIEQKIEQDIEQQTKHLATKEDIALMKADVERGFKEQGKWMLGIFITLTVMILGLYAAILLKR